MLRARFGFLTCPAVAWRESPPWLARAEMRSGSSPWESAWVGAFSWSSRVIRWSCEC